MSKRVYIGNLPWSFSSSDLENLFAEFGAVVSATVITDRATGRSRGFGFVEMDDAGAADQAIAQLDSKEVSGRQLRVNLAREREQWRPEGR